MLGSRSKSCYRGLLERARQQYYSCYTRRWFQAIPVIDVEPLVKRQQVRAKSHVAEVHVAEAAVAEAYVRAVQNAAVVAQQLHKACHEVGFFYVCCAVPTGCDSVWPECPVKTLIVCTKYTGCQPRSTTTDLPECLEGGPCLVCSAGIYPECSLV